MGTARRLRVDESLQHQAEGDERAEKDDGGSQKPVEGTDQVHYVVDCDRATCKDRVGTSSEPVLTLADVSSWLMRWSLPSLLPHASKTGGLADKTMETASA